jgi:sulfatase modifying factor 1
VGRVQVLQYAQILRRPMRGRARTSGPPRARPTRASARVPWVGVGQPSAGRGPRRGPYARYGHAARFNVRSRRNRGQSENGGHGYAPPTGSGIHSYLHDGQGLVDTSGPGTYETGWVASDTSYINPTDDNLAYCGAFSTWTPSRGMQENLPINCVNWYEAYAFCIWDEALLPSEAEWEFVAAGGDQQREFPWGTDKPGSDNQYAIYGYGNAADCYFPSAGPCTGASNFAPVGTSLLGAGRWGQLDLAGNVAEWNLDWYAMFVEPAVDGAALTAASFRVIRGGAYNRNAATLLPTVPEGRYPSGRNSDVGFRCSRAP